MNRLLAAAGATGVYAVAQVSDIPGRAEVLAAEIVAAAPDLIGVQQAVIWSRNGVVDADFLQ